MRIRVTRRYADAEDEIVYFTLTEEQVQIFLSGKGVEIPFHDIGMELLCRTDIEEAIPIFLN